MTPEAKRRMDVYQEGQRAYNADTPCPYHITDWRRKTWHKGLDAAHEYHQQNAVVAHTNVELQPTPAEQWADICERSQGYLQTGSKGLMIDEADLVLIGTLLGA